MRLRNLCQLFRGACCREKRDDHKAHDEGRSLIYDAKKCNAVSAQFFRNPNGTVLYGPIYVARLLAKGIDHSRPRLMALEHPSRKVTSLPCWQTWQLIQRFLSRERSTSSSIKRPVSVRIGDTDGARQSDGKI